MGYGAVQGLPVSQATRHASVMRSRQKVPSEGTSLRTTEEARMRKQIGLGWLAAGAALCVANAAVAQTELQWWHAMTGANNDLIVKLAEEFNAGQKDYKVAPSYRGGYPDTLNAGIAAFRAGQAPHIIQVF